LSNARLIFYPGLRKNFNLATEFTEFTEKFLFFSVFPVTSVAKNLISQAEFFSAPAAFCVRWASMKTPAGKECRFYHEDFFRGKETQECRLLEMNPRGGKWKPSLCGGCPVPDILRQNACPNLVLEASVSKGWLGLGERVKVFAVCAKTMNEVSKPEVGCGECHPRVF
jgi:hypothetical protein